MSDIQSHAPTQAAASPPTPRPQHRNPPRKLFGLPFRDVAPVLIVCAALAWGVWVSKGIHDLSNRRDHIVTVRLSEIVTEYVQATARSSLPPEQIGQQTALFLKAVNESVEKHRAAGQVVLLANAVVAGDVPDITNDVRAQVYSKVARPQPVAAPANVQGAMQQYMATNAAVPANGQ